MTEATVSAVSLKLPTFWPERVEVWFAQAEAQFAIRGITSDATRFHYIVQALDQDTATRVLDLLLHPPEEDKYKTLKQRLLDLLYPNLNALVVCSACPVSAMANLPI